MQKREPVIIAPDYTDDELYEWMHQKINAAQDLKWANEARAKQAENLSALEQDITNLEKSSGIKHCQNDYIPALVANQQS
ncbi:putative prophage protein [Escherichia coli]|uniref:Putative prophage protein n=7 Tax=Escherichia coli TaxID=562 RepID=A0A376U874_ECOLX|nr:putative prophage protein [Escherichia coli]